MKQVLIALLFIITTGSFGQNIFKALSEKDYVELEEILKNGETTQQYNEKGLTPLWLAIFKNDTIAVNLLIRFNADINYPEKKGMHPIMVGCMANSYESVKILLENGVDVNWKSEASRNQQPIRFASVGGSLKLVKLLISYGADIESTPDDKGTPLLASLHAKKFEIAEYYFSVGANVNVVGRDGETVIHEAIKTGNPEMVRLAVKYKAPMDYRDPKGKTTLELAKQSGDRVILEIVKKAINSEKK